MTKEQIIVANLKCNGCASTIRKELSKIEGLTDLEIDVEESTIHYAHEGVDKQVVINKLSSLGYPEINDKNGLLTQLKSYGSCMVGKLNS